MVPQQRRPPPSAQDYYAVPQSPQTSMQGPYNQSRPPARSRSSGSQMQPGRGAIAQGVANGQIGSGYGPYSVSLLVLSFCVELVVNKPLQVQSILITEQRRPQPFTVQCCRI